MGIFDKLKRTKEEKEQLKETAKASDTKESGKAKKKASGKKEESTTKAKDAASDKKKATPAAAKPLGDSHSVLVMPILTEKTFNLQQTNKYCFYVSQDANKHQVKSAMKEVYGIAPLSVNILRKRPQAKKRWGRKVGMSKGLKKAIITMPEGTILNLTE
jgi:large subunit ribosomal protein L23